MNSVHDKVVDILATQLNISKDTIKDDSTLQSLGADSLERVEIVLKIEEEFGIDMSDEDEEKLQTLSDIVGYVNQKTK